MSKKSLPQSGFGIIALIILLAAVCIAFFVGQHIYTTQKAVKSVTDYAQCVKQKSAKILQTFPEQCVFDGKTFTNLANEIKNSNSN